MKKYILSIILAILGIGCFVSFNIIGSYVAPDGTLIEPFYLIPLGFMSFFISFIAGVYAILKKN